MAFHAPEVYKLSNRSELKRTLVGSYLGDVPTPAAVLDRHLVEKNCRLMLEAVERLKVKFRAHVKTHKTTEITQLQVSHDCKDVRLIVSTVIEAEQLLPLLLDYRSRGANVNVLYGVPPSSSAIVRLAGLAKQLGSGSISFMIDHLDQLDYLAAFNERAGIPPSIFLKADAGTHRAGVEPGSSQMAELITIASEMEEDCKLILQGIYSHAGHSYGGSTPGDAMEMLAHEISVAVAAAKRYSGHPLILSIGASPTVLSIQNLQQTSTSTAAKLLTDRLALDPSKFLLEFHAGVYPLLDMQQIATNARVSSASTSDIALTILAEVVSLYPERSQPEALIAAGCLALAREPCKDYKGWGVISPWNIAEDEIHKEERLIVSRISQEHGIVAYEKEDSKRPLPLKYGQKIRIWPNHACIASAMYGWYLIVDSSSNEPDKLIDVWPRWRGW